MRRTVSLVTVGLAWIATQWGSNGADLAMQLKAEKASVLIGEPVFLRLLIQNSGTNRAVVAFGRRMVENLLVSTSLDPAPRSNRLLSEGGAYANQTVVAVNARQKYEDRLLLDDWLALPPGTNTLKLEISHDPSRLAASLQIIVAEGTDDALEAALREVVWRAGPKSGAWEESELSRRALKRTCQRSDQAKRVLRRIERKLGANDSSLPVLQEILKNYAKGVAD